MLRNNRGKLKFYHVQDWTGRIQLMVSRGDLSEEQWELVGALDLGDLIGIDGRLRVCLLYTSPSPRDGLLSRMPSSA